MNEKGRFNRHGLLKRLSLFLMAFILAVGLMGQPWLMGLTTEAKTLSSAKAERVFFYGVNHEGKSVLLKVIPIADLKALSHGQLSEVTTGRDTGENYYISTTDNYPTTQYCEARGITIPELVAYVKSVTTVTGADRIDFTGSDTLRLMATDSYGNYSRSWTWDQLYGVDRYYFEGMYDDKTGWNTGWEIAGDDNSKFGVTLDEYNSRYEDSDPYYQAKRDVFKSGKKTAVILATESFSGRTTSRTLQASTEVGIAEYIEKNSGVVAGSLKDELTDDYSLRLSLPMTEADLMVAHRTSYDNFKWIYNVQLDMGAEAPAMKSMGMVAEPVASVTLSPDGKTASIKVTCKTEGASIYYSFDGAPQTEYKEPVSLDVSGRNLTSDPITFYMTAVKEGYEDGGVVTVKYPGMSPAFQTIYSSMAGRDIVFTAAEEVTDSDWTAWTKAFSGMSLKSPSTEGYATVDTSKYKISDSARSITVDKSLFTETGSYSFLFKASKYSNRNISLTVKRAVPAVKAAESYALGGGVTLTFDDPDYQKGLSLYVKKTGEEQGTIISASYLDRGTPGQVTVKPSYFALPSCAMPEAGSYTLSLVSNTYSPGTQDVNIVLSSGFGDVAQSAWYKEAVAFVVDKGLFNGTGPGKFSPDATLTRGMFVTVLGRLFGADTSMYEESGFSDVGITAWYGPYAAWAAEKGIASGVGNGRFDPDGFITRAQMARMLYGCSKVSAGETADADGTAFDSFPDVSAVPNWAVDPMKWAVSNGLINGIDGKLAPSGNATRAQAAAILMRYDGLIGTDAGPAAAQQDDEKR
ncbi:MAG TPA: S-layer homology domain-containing protein [Bacillota bacterium]|nr:S-layer homology domain-containing protein [Bacillota bacterium]